MVNKTLCKFAVLKSLKYLHCPMYNKHHTFVWNTILIDEIAHFLNLHCHWSNHCNNRGYVCFTLYIQKCSNGIESKAMQLEWLPPGSLVPRPIPSFSMLNAEKREEGPGMRSRMMEREGPEHFASQKSLDLWGLQLANDKRHGDITFIRVKGDPSTAQTVCL